MAFERQILQL